MTSDATGSIQVVGLSSGSYSSIITSLNGCSSVGQSTVLTDPTPPSVSASLNQVVFSNTAVGAIIFSGTAGAVFHWTNDNTAIGLGTNGTLI